MRVLIDNYRNLTAGHCGSGAMRNLIYHYTKLELDEAVVFGLGGGLDCICTNLPEAEPSLLLFGRNGTMEADLRETLGIDYSEQIELDDDAAWQQVRDEVIAGRPTMLSGDIFYLDYREFKVHFPAHRFVLVGFDDDKQEVYVADRTDEDIQTCSMQALRQSRNSPAGMSSMNMWGKFTSDKVKHDLPYACGLALHKTVLRMQGIDRSQLELMQGFVNSDDIAVGLDGIQAFRYHLAGWRDSSKLTANAQYVDNCIVKFGTGGGFFRDHFAKFMHWAKAQRPDLVTSTTTGLAEEAAAAWNQLALTMQQLQQHPNDDAVWQQADAAILDLYETEYTLFGFLGDTVLRSSA